VHPRRWIAADRLLSQYVAACVFRSEHVGVPEIEKHVGVTRWRRRLLGEKETPAYPFPVSTPRGSGCTPRLFQAAPTSTDLSVRTRPSSVKALNVGKGLVVALQLHQ
jgi:hypothetical protein